MLKESLCYFLCSGHKRMHLQLLRLICQLLLLSLERERPLQGENSEQQKLISFFELPFLGTSCIVTDRESHILHPSVSLVHIPLRTTTKFVIFYVKLRGACFPYLGLLEIPNPYFNFSCFENCWCWNFPSNLQTHWILFGLRTKKY